ncbi:hypothetical protein [Tumidithrix helvetica]|uniref:hypothetical protein n=1 Tax=Tumidithrix helvetica TaxID=3457545 RepID=UPI003CC55214
MISIAGDVAEHHLRHLHVSPCQLKDPAMIHTSTFTGNKPFAKKMENIQIVRCPNCGNYAERQYFATKELVQTRCASCDYSIAICTTTGKVFEYSLGASRRCIPHQQVAKLEAAWEISPSLPNSYASSHSSSDSH